MTDVNEVKLPDPFMAFCPITADERSAARRLSAGELH